MPKAEALDSKITIYSFPKVTQMSNSNVEKPNNAEEWERQYLSTPKAIIELQHPVAQLMAELTDKGDVLLETGCGSAQVSAELASVGRKIELADFSQKILDQAAEVFHLSKLPEPALKCCDLTVFPWTWPDLAVDVSWSAGVLEHWTDEEIMPMFAEMARISRKQVVSLVPYANSLFYRLGKDYAERSGTWPYGREIPRHTLRHVFEAAGLTDIQEWDILAEHSLVFLDMIDPKFREIASNWWNSLEPNDPAKIGQGYALVTVGKKK